MLAALEAHQAAFLQDAAPTLVNKPRQDKGKAVAKPIWEMEMDDFDDDSHEDADEQEGESSLLSSLLPMFNLDEAAWLFR